MISPRTAQREITAWDEVAILISLHNEEASIRETIEQIQASTGLPNNTRLYIVNDGSSDQSANIIASMITSSPIPILLETIDRSGKPAAIQYMIDRYDLNTKGKAILLMDANISVAHHAVSKICAALSMQNIGMVGASVYPTSADLNMESRYILRENQIKENEAKAFGAPVGVFGACYGIRGELYRRVPKNFITDDLYQTFSIVRQGYQIDYRQDIKVHEHIAWNVMNEFQRKRRFSAGNFQILIHFWDLLMPRKSHKGFVYAYFFHKVMRWICPVVLFMLWIYACATNQSEFSRVLAIAGAAVWGYMLVYRYLVTPQMKFALGSAIYYFLMMNLAILLGFFDYLIGIKTNIWQRSERTDI